MSEAEPLWASGPGEILRHGIGLLKEDSDTNRRLAMISIDNSVELMMQTYIQLPKRITNVEATRKQRDEACESFPKLLDAIEAYAGTKIVGIDLGEIEWFHRLRNRLYHDGNGLTVERRNVEVYAELASAFFKSLFGIRLNVSQRGSMHLLGEFLDAYVSIEASIRNASNRTPPLTSGMAILDTVKNGVLDEREYADFERIRKVRNLVVHSPEGKDIVTPDLVDAAKKIAHKMNVAFPKASK